MRGLAENLALSLTRIAIFVLLALRLVQVWINPVDDYDTSSFILGVQGGYYPGFEWFFDLAHPGLLSAWHRWSCSWWSLCCSLICTPREQTVGC